MNRRARKVALQAVDEWLHRGDMAKVLRRVLPSSGLSPGEREEVAEVVHRVVRFFKRYTHILSYLSYPPTPSAYVKLALNEIEYGEEVLSDAPPHITLSASEVVSEVLERHPQYIHVINREPETYLSVNLLKESREGVKGHLEEEGLSAEEFLPETALRVPSRGRYSRVVEEGLAHVQDPSSQFVAKISARLGRDVLDYCAGNGGKSLTMAYYGAMVSSYDLNRLKLRNLEMRARVYGVPVRVEWWPNAHEVVLVDAPCSGLGAASRNPEVKYYRDLKGFPVKQMRVLTDGARFSKGFLVYSVCTFTEEETEKVVGRFLRKRKAFEAVQLEDMLESLLNRDELRLIRYTPMGALIEASDIMYISVLKKR